MKYLPLMLLVVVAACGTHPIPEGPALTDEQRDRLEQIRDEARTLTPIDTLLEDCDFGVVGGSLCFAGEEWACDAMAGMQDMDGRLWRNPYQCSNGSDFSRDQMLGWLMMLMETGDIEVGNRTTAYVNRINGVCEQELDECGLRPTLTHMYNLVAKHVGFTPLHAKAPDPSDLVVWLQAATVPKGYQMHLVAMKLLMLKRMGYRSKGVAEAAKVLSGREPGNPLYATIAGKETYSKVVNFWNAARQPRCYWPHGWMIGRAEGRWCGGALPGAVTAGSGKAYLGSSGWDVVYTVSIVLLNE